MFGGSERLREGQRLDISAVRCRLKQRRYVMKAGGKVGLKLKGESRCCEESVGRSSEGSVGGRHHFSGVRGMRLVTPWSEILKRGEERVLRRGWRQVAKGPRCSLLHEYPACTYVQVVITVLPTL